MLIKDVLHVVTRKRKEGYFGEPSKRKTLVGSGSRIWATLNETTRAYYETVGAGYRAEQKRKLAADMTEKVSALQVVAAQGERGISEPGGVRVSSCSFSVSELQTFDATWQSQDRCRDEADAFEASHAQAIVEPPEVIKTELCTYVCVAMDARHPWPWWGRTDVPTQGSLLGCDCALAARRRRVDRRFHVRDATAIHSRLSLGVGEEDGRGRQLQLFVFVVGSVGKTRV
jgi:hypothetical protein